MLSEFKPALFFLGRFLGIYVFGNLIYGLYVESFDNKPDAITIEVAEQSTWILNKFGYVAKTWINPARPTVLITKNNKIVISVFEGCNGVNVIIIFIAFLVAFGGEWKKMTCFSLTGLLVIHSSNLLRISLLYITAGYFQSFFYYFHKYLFTAVLYMVVLALWIIWIFCYQDKLKPSSNAN